MHLIICYDIVSNRRRTRLAKALKCFLRRVQKSVFQGEMEDVQLTKLKRTIANEIDQNEDTVRLYRICTRCRISSEQIGNGRSIDYVEDADEIV